MDVAWLIEKAANLIAGRMSIDGGVLKFTADFVVSHTPLSLADWPEMASLIQVNREDPSSPGRRLRIALWRATEAVIGGKFQIDFNLAHAVDHLETLAQKVFEVPLPKNWSEPPIHHTASNCWHCGKFTSNAELTQRDRAEGWGTFRVGSGPDGVELKDVHCPECGREIRAKVQAASKTRSSSTSRSAPAKPAPTKSAPAKSSPGKSSLAKTQSSREKSSAVKAKASHGKPTKK